MTTAWRDRATVRGQKKKNDDNINIIIKMIMTKSNNNKNIYENINNNSMLCNIMKDKVIVIIFLSA